MAKISAKQRENIERYKKRGWRNQDLEKCRGLRFSRDNRTNFMDSMIVPLDFDPQPVERMTRTELSYLMDV